MPQIQKSVLEEELRNILADIVEIDKEEITLDAHFVEDLGMDSMMALEVMAALEKKYKINIPEQNLTKMINLRQTLDLVLKYSNK